MAKPIIGKEIKDVVKLRKLTADELASALNVSKPNIYDIYKRSSVDTGLLERLCKVLDYNFFSRYAIMYSTEKEKEQDKMYKERIKELEHQLKEKDEVYRVLLKQLDK
jgi:transcriptional regulator with XRE-family HTH domain